ncbi:MAG: nucleoside triphosphate pyrophosphohydrolase [Pseudomonadota bacterium]
MKASENIDRLLEIMEALRTPETGCPWDLEQTFETIAPYTVEEAYEVADAIERKDMEDLRLELGDLLLQSVYHSRLAEEQGHFNFADVVEGITGKMIRRHPHVFGTEDVSAAEYSAKGMAEGTWERIKAEEKQEMATRRTAKGLPAKSGQEEGLLDSVPTTLPAMTSAFKLQTKAAKVGFDWPQLQQVLDKTREEFEEFGEELSNGNQKSQREEIGDLLFSIVNVARHLDIDPEFALRQTNIKFRNRFSHIEKRVKDQGRLLNDASLEEMEQYWQEAKKPDQLTDL